MNFKPKLEWTETKTTTFMDISSHECMSLHDVIIHFQLPIPALAVN